jgi:hypothetical protein
MFGVQPRKKRLRHDRIADPGGGDNEGFHRKTVAGRDEKTSPAAGLVMALGGLAREHVLSAAVRANRFTGFQNIQENTRMLAPKG